MEFIIGIGNSIFDKVVEFGVQPVCHQIGHFFHSKRNVESLRSQIQWLKFAKDTIDHSVAEARDNCGEVIDAVQQWLKDTEKISSDAEKLVSLDEGQAYTGCSIRSFSTLIKRYKVGKEARNIAAVIAAKVELAEKFGSVYYRVPLSNSFKIKGYQKFKTRVGVVVELMEALRDDRICMIGVWGMGGVGKTMLVKEVARQAKCENLFSRVIFATVSQTLDYKTIQQEVAETLGLQIEENSVALRAIRLRERLKSEDKILIILDDIWSNLDLEKVGLSFADDKKECKIILTSRSQHLLCNSMDVDRHFKLGVLHEFEATNLFDRIAGDRAKEREFQKVKKKILQKCAGLPLAISIVAKALKDKSTSIWEDALQELSTSNPANITGVEEEVFAVIRWSYDLLQSEEAKSILLLCSLHKQDEDINIEELLMYGMGLRLFHGIQKLQDARNRLSHLVDILKSASLLLDARIDNCVRMHDVTRNVVLSIASKDKQMYFISNDEDVKERLNDNELQNSTAIALSLCSGVLLRGKLCPKLQLFSIVESKLKLEDDHFEGARDLKVLGLHKMNVTPSSFSSFRRLINLKTLIISQCELGGIESIGELSFLEMLDLSGSDFKMVPKQLRNLTCLLSLNLSHCKFLEVIEPGVISSFQRLEELHMESPSFTHWAPVTEVFANTCCSLTELKQLRRLTTLSMHILDADTLLPDGLFANNLERYQIYVTSSSHSHYQPRRLDANEHKWSRLLELDEVSDTLLLKSSLKLLIKRAQNLHINKVNIFNTLCDELGECGYLKVLKLMDARTGRYFLNTLCGASAFQHLEELHLLGLAKLETICDGCDLSVDNMAKLRVIVVQRCCSLKNLFPLSFSYRQLEELEVSDCEAMEDIFIDIKNDDEMIMIDFPLLSCVKLQRLPKLKQFVAQRRDNGLVSADHVTGRKGAPLFHHNVGFPALNKLTLIELDSVMVIWPNDYNEQITNNSFNKLKEVKVSSCSSLKSLFTASVGKTLHDLESIRLENCCKLREIIAKEEGPTSIVSKFVFPRLSSLYFSKLPELESLCSNLHSSEWPSLDELALESCGKVKILASQLLDHRENTRAATLSANTPLFIMDTVAFPKLKKIGLFRLDQLEVIWQTDQNLIPGSFGKLESIIISRCNALTKVFSLNLLVKLESLIAMTVDDCAKMEEVIEMERPTSCGRVISPLTFLGLSSLPKLKHVWNCKDQCNPQSGGPIRKFKFPKLATIRLRFLPELEQFYPGLHTSEWPSLSNIILEKCGKVKILASAISTFERSMIQQAQTSTPLFLMEAVAFPKVKIMILHSLDRLESICQGDPELIIADSFGKLERISITHCSALMKAFPYNILGNLRSLTQLIIKNCNNVEEVFEIQRSARIGSERVIIPITCLTLDNLPKLRHVWSHKDHSPPHFGAPKLKIVNLVGCPSLESLFPKSVAEDLLELESVHLKGCDQMREIVGEDKEATEIMPKFVFHKLTSIFLTGLPELKHFYPGLHTSEWPSLHNISLENCGGVKILASELSTFKKTTSSEAQAKTPLFLMEKVAFPKLKKIGLTRLNQLEMICQSDQELIRGSFGEFERISIRSCDALINVFSHNLLGNLESLIEVHIEYCGQMKEVFEMQTSCERVLIVPLTSLYLSFLPKLEHVWNYKDQSRRLCFTTPELKKVDATYCPSLKSLFPASVAKDLLKLKSIVLKGCYGIQEIIAEEKEATEIVPKFEFPKLTSMFLSNLWELKCLYPGLHTSECYSLRDLTLENCVKIKILASPIAVFKRAMSREAHDYTPLFMMDTVTFPSLNKMILNSFGGLEMIWELGDNHVEENREPVASQLSILMFSNLPNLKGFLFPSSTSFKRLTTLALSGCDVKSLFAPSTATSMPQLTALSISKCISMTEVMSDASEDGEIVFNKLEVLGLVCLPKLVCFHPGHYTLLFPNLEKIFFLQCPEMRSFSSEAIIPKLKGIITKTGRSDAFSFEMWYNCRFSATEVSRRVGLGEEQSWDGDINSTLKKLHCSEQDRSREQELLLR